MNTFVLNQKPVLISGKSLGLFGKAERACAWIPCPEDSTVRPFCVVEPVRKPVFIFPIGCCDHAVLDCVRLVVL